MAATSSTKTIRVLKTSNADFKADWKKFCQRRDDSVGDVEKEAKKFRNLLDFIDYGALPVLIEKSARIRMGEIPGIQRFQ